MSADNGIYILKTTGPGSFEYRVVHAQAIDNLYYNVETGEHDQNFRPEEAFIYFGKSLVWYDEKSALVYAHRLADSYPILEYGVCILDHSGQLFQSFTEEEIAAYDKWVDETIEKNREDRDIG